MQPKKAGITPVCEPSKNEITREETPAFINKNSTFAKNSLQLQNLLH